MLEHNVDAFLRSELAIDPLETVGPVTDDVIGTQRFAFCLASSPTVVMTIHPIALAMMMAASPDAERRRTTRSRRALELRIIGAACAACKAIGAQAASAQETFWDGENETCGHIHQIAQNHRYEIQDSPTLSQRLSRPSLHALQLPQVRHRMTANRSPGLNPVSDGPGTAISPAASTPTTTGMLRRAKAIPR
jgi:hypothetical protein